MRALLHRRGGLRVQLLLVEPVLRTLLEPGLGLLWNLSRFAGSVSGPQNLVSVERFWRRFASVEISRAASLSIMVHLASYFVQKDTASGPRRVCIQPGCHQPYSLGTGNGTLIKHLKERHPAAWKKAQETDSA